MLDASNPVSEGRSRCARCGFVDYQNPRPCVAVLIREGRSVLLARRAVEPARGQWDIPGGFVDHGESAEDAVVREALEETSLHVRVVEFLGSLPDVYGERGWPTLNLGFLATVVSGDPAARSDVAELRWVDVGRLPDRTAFGHQKQMLLWARACIVGGRNNPEIGRP